MREQGRLTLASCLLYHHLPAANQKIRGAGIDPESSSNVSKYHIVPHLVLIPNVDSILIFAFCVGLFSYEGSFEFIRQIKKSVRSHPYRIRSLSDSENPTVRYGRS